MTKPAAGRVPWTLCAFVLFAGATAAQAPRVTLTGFAVLPADTFAEGPPSGASLQTDKPGVPQFPSQPVQGVSALWPAGDGEWFALSDNGFGTRANSADYLLRVYRLRVEWESDARPGNVTFRGFTQLADPDRRLPFPIQRETTSERWLTGADLDPESMVRLPDGTWWIGDEFGPFLLHFSADGRLLERPFEVPGLRSPDHPGPPLSNASAGGAVTLRRSRGFEGLARFGDRLYAAIEAGSGSDADAAIIYEFDLTMRAFTGMRWRLPLISAEHALTEFVSLAEASPQCGARFLAVERDGLQGAAARTKRVHEVILAGNGLSARVVVDLLDIANPRRIGTQPATFAFPFITTEAVWPTSLSELVLANDNNFPAGGGREGLVRDPTEFIRLSLDAPLCAF